jgi:hypothetical protein
MPNGISANLLAQADERDPRTLGTDEVETPGGEMDVGELLSARSEDLGAVAQKMRQTMDELGSYFDKVAGFEYDEFTRRGRRGQRILSLPGGVDADSASWPTYRPGVKLDRGSWTDSRGLLTHSTIRRRGPGLRC